MNVENRTGMLVRAVLVWIFIGTAQGNYCCPGDIPVDTEDHSCLGMNGTLRLDCGERGMYNLDPVESPDDTFVLAPTGELIVGEAGVEYNLTNNSFCLAKLSTAGEVTEHRIAMVCFPEVLDEEIESSNIRYVLNGVCLSISVGFLIITLLVYLTLPDLRDLDGKCLMGYMLSLALAYISLALLQFHGHSYEHVLCIVQAFFLYFWMLSAFFWLNLVSFNVWRRTRWCRPSAYEKNMFTYYCCYGYGVPLLFLILALATDHIEGDHIKPRFGHTKCWFHGPTESWLYFYGPVAVLVLCNVVFFVWTAWCLWQDYSHIKVEGKLRSLRYKCLLYLKLSFLMGITWIFEVISFIADDVAFFWYGTDVLNCLQGLIIFLLMVVFRKRVLRGLVKHKPWGVKVPHTWAQGVDEESEAMLAEEELSQTQIPH